MLSVSWREEKISVEIELSIVFFFSLLRYRDIVNYFINETHTYVKRIKMIGKFFSPRRRTRTPVYTVNQNVRLTTERDESCITDTRHNCGRGWFNPFTSRVNSSSQQLVCRRHRRKWVSRLRYGMASVSRWFARRICHGLCSSIRPEYRVNGRKWRAAIPNLSRSITLTRGRIHNVLWSRRDIIHIHIYTRIYTHIRRLKFRSNFGELNFSRNGYRVYVYLSNVKKMDFVLFHYFRYFTPEDLIMKVYVISRKLKKFVRFSSGGGKNRSKC